MNTSGRRGAAPPRSRNPARRADEILLGVKLRGALRGKERYKERFLDTLGSWIESLDVGAEGSAYRGYYELKGEDFPLSPSSRWKTKQRVVYSALESLHPHTVLDVGANTGWYSLLAARMGCRVVAFDTDEGCMNNLARRAAAEGLDVLPLVMDLLDLTPDIYPDPALPVVQAREGGEPLPLMLAADRRLRCDTVMALAIVHHLALGEGRGFEEICGLLAGFAQRALILEFVDRNDELVAAEPDFFPACYRKPDGFSWYTLENLLECLGRHFEQIEVRDSHPGTRKVVVCEGRRKS